MKNVGMPVEGDILIIKVDLSKDFGPSKSGKTLIVASTDAEQIKEKESDLIERRITISHDI